MNPLLQFAPAVALLAVAWRVRRTLARFRAAGALAPATARSLAELGVGGRGLAMKVLRRHRVLVEVEDGRFYLDTAAHERWRRRRRLILAGVLIAIAVGLVIIVATHS